MRTGKGWALGVASAVGILLAFGQAAWAQFRLPALPLQNQVPKQGKIVSPPNNQIKPLPRAVGGYLGGSYTGNTNLNWPPSPWNNNNNNNAPWNNNQWNNNQWNNNNPWNTTNPWSNPWNNNNQWTNPWNTNPWNANPWNANPWNANPIGPVNPINQFPNNNPFVVPNWVNPNWNNNMNWNWQGGMSPFMNNAPIVGVGFQGQNAVPFNAGFAGFGGFGGK